MGCITAKESSNSYIEVQPVTPGTMTVFGAKYIVPHGKRVILSFDKNRSEDFIVSDVTNGEKDGMALFEVNRREACAVKDAISKEEIFTMLQSVGDAEDRTVCSPDGSKMFTILPLAINNNKHSTGQLKNKRGEIIQLVSDGIDFPNSTGIVNLYCEDPASPNTGVVNKEKPIAKVCSPGEVDYFLSTSFVFDHYLVEIAPGVDMAVIMAIMLAQLAFD